MAESVWDYPRPPRVEPSERRVRVVLGGETIVDTTEAVRVLETSHPPVFYVPPQDVAEGVLVPSQAPETFCEWKGTASYLDAVVGEKARRAGGVDIPRSGSGLRGDQGRNRVLPGEDGRLLRRRRARGSAAGRLLRRLDHVRRRRPVQGRGRHVSLIAGTGSQEAAPSAGSPSPTATTSSGLRRKNISTAATAIMIALPAYATWNPSTSAWACPPAVAARPRPTSVSSVASTASVARIARPSAPPICCEVL